MSKQGTFMGKSSWMESSACWSLKQLLSSSNPVSENKTFLGLKSFRILIYTCIHAIAFNLLSEITTSGGSPSQEEAYMFSLKLHHISFWNVVVWNFTKYFRWFSITGGSLHVFFRTSSHLFLKCCRLKFYHINTYKNVTILQDISCDLGQVFSVYSGFLHQ